MIIKLIYKDNLNKYINKIKKHGDMVFYLLQLLVRLVYVVYL
jgi:hypothetical protein